MREVNPHFLIAFGVLGALSVVAVASYLTRVVYNIGVKDDPALKASADGKSIEVAGKTYGLHSIQIRPGLAHWVLSLPAAARTFSVQRKDGLRALIDHLGAMPKVSTGDARFDSEFETLSRDADWTKTFFSDAENRRLVHALFGLDCTAVILSDGRIQACFEERADLADGGPALSDLAGRLAAPGAA